MVYRVGEGIIKREKLRFGICTLSQKVGPALTSPAAESNQNKTCLEFVEEQLQNLRCGHGAVDTDICDGAVRWREHRCLREEAEGESRLREKNRARAGGDFR